MAAVVSSGTSTPVNASLLAASGAGAKTLSREDVRRSWKPWLRGTALGFPFGAMPTGGAEIPTFLSYAVERRLARGKAKEEFGNGAIEDVAS